MNWLKELESAVWRFFNPYLQEMSEHEERINAVETRLTVVETAVDEIAQRMTEND